MQRIIVTGKNGGLSVAVADHLRKNGFETDNLGLRGEEWKSFDLSGYDAVVHIAGIVPKDGVKSEDYYKINSDLTASLAEKAKAEGVGQFVYVSSMAVYGVAPTLKRGKGVVTAERACAPTDDYGKSKLLAEKALDALKDERFGIAVIRVPSIYGEGKTEYLEQYGYSFGRLKFLPYAFSDRYKSVICTDNLCELIRLVLKNRSRGLFCPDDGRITAFDLASAVMPYKKSSRLLGALVSLTAPLERTRDYYGEVCYDRALTEIFDGAYRIRNYREVIKSIYEK